MPKRTDVQKILLIGAGPIVIGQACEFDYSGTQGAKALRQEGYDVVLVNSNPATIMTDPELARRTYVEPLEPRTLEAILERERPQAILPTLGGQTALNLALELHRRGVLDRLGVEMLGAKPEAIAKAEDRALFKAAMEKIGLQCPRAGVAHSVEEAWKVVEETGFPAILRPSFTLGGSGGGIAYTKERARAEGRVGALAVADARGADRRERARLEGVRARGHPRSRRQLHRRLLDREPRPDGRAHGRLDHRRARDDAHRPRVPAPARRREARS